VPIGLPSAKRAVGDAGGSGVPRCSSVKGKANGYPTSAIRANSWLDLRIGGMKMSTERVPITPEGYKKLQEELKRLKTVERPQIIKMIEHARSLGDLSENAEYESAKHRQGLIEGRIQELESKIARAEVIDPSNLPNKDRVMFGVRVTLEEVESGDTVTYRLVGPDESEPENGLISVISPIGRALLGKRVDDEVRVQTPGGVREFIVLKIE
jgi:transcription elongation factor GreA